MDPSPFDVRLAAPSEVPLLPELERVAGLMFKTYPADLGIPDEVYEGTNSVETYADAQQAGRLWVATIEGVGPVGLALVLEVGGYAHLDELDVLPDHGKRGIGSALLRTVCEWATRQRYPAVTLRTFREVPWNEPFYERRGFRVVENAAVSEAHLALEVAERRLGLRTDNRVTMIWSAQVRD